MSGGTYARLSGAGVRLVLLALPLASFWVDHLASLWHHLHFHHAPLAVQQALTDGCSTNPASLLPIDATRQKWHLWTVDTYGAVWNSQIARGGGVPWHLNLLEEDATRADYQ